jgi:hypothetical protein
MSGKKWVIDAIRRLRAGAANDVARAVGGPSMEQLEPRKLLATYYISPFGNDANPGTSTTRPWQTLGKVAFKSFAAGDQVLLQGGQFFSGSIYFASDDKGTALAPIKVGSYGTGRATVKSVGQSGLYGYNTAGISVSNLNFVGDGGSAGATAGIAFYTDNLTNTKHSFIRIDNVDAGWYQHGVMIGGENGSAGFKDIRVTNSSLHDNLKSGMFTFATNFNVHEQLYVGKVRAFNNTGVPFPAGTFPAEVTGHGILLGNVNGATVERSVAFNNGRVGDGGAGIWTYNSTKVVFQYNESYNNWTAGTRDGDGFDFDQNVSNSIMQYNYSHGNAGAGFIMATRFSTNHTKNIVRYNITQNDCRKNPYGALQIYGRTTFSEWYNNTVYLGAGTAAGATAMRVSNLGIPANDVASVHFRNNIVQTTGGVPMIIVVREQLDGAVDFKFQGNNFYSSGATFRITWGSTTYSSLTAWRTATGQEKVNGVATGFSVDPQFTAPGAGPTFGNADLLKNLTAYKLKSTSPLINKGLDLFTLFGVSSGGKDYMGTLLPQGGMYEVGAIEFV